MSEGTNRPIVYGTPQQFALLMEAITRLTDHEPDETFDDFNVRIAARRLMNLIERRLDTGSPNGTRGMVSGNNQ